MLVRDLMSAEVVTLGREETLDIADRIMNLGRIRHMPVVDDEGRLCGLVSQRDLFRGALASALGMAAAAQSRLLGALLVREVMAADPITTTPDTPLGEAAAIMLRRKIGCLPVVEGERLVGIITEADFVAHVAALSAADSTTPPGSG
ncbi:MAG TPA: CBS domain-containing protein [Kofleriaceae bacterium]|nr:CBS domain-containing protein [Kofleriaceae bacterium]